MNQVFQLICHTQYILLPSHTLQCMVCLHSTNENILSYIILQLQSFSFRPNIVIKFKLEILQSLGGLYDGLAFYALHWSYAPSL